jgi:hypothetical protein
VNAIAISQEPAAVRVSRLPVRGNGCLVPTQRSQGKMLDVSDEQVGDSTQAARQKARVQACMRAAARLNRRATANA